MPGGSFSGPRVDRFCLPLPASGIVTLAIWFCVCSLSGCSLLINVDHDQCREQSDCAKLGLLGSCVQGVCALASPQTCDGGAACSSSSDAQDGATQCAADHPCALSTDACFKAQCAAASDVQSFICSAPPVTGASAANSVVPVTMHVQEIVSQAPPRGLVATACRTSDLTCADPVATWIDNRTSGDVVLQLPSGFDGFLQIVSEDTLAGLYFLTQPLSAALRVDTVELIAPTTLTTLFGVTGSAPDATKGLVVLQLFDCGGNPAAGVHFEESKTDGTPFYFVNSLPNTDSQLTVRDDASNQAWGGFLNVTPGAQIFSARIGVNGPLLGRFNVNVRANTVTYLDIHP